MAFGALSSLLKPKEIKAVEYELQILFDQHFASYKTMMLKNALKNVDIDRKEIVQGIRNEHRVPHEVALTIVNNMAAHMVTSGRYHTFFGVLDPDEGGRLYWIFDKTLEMLEKHRYLTDQEIKDTRDNVNILISTVG